MPKAVASKSIEGLAYEAAMAELQGIVAALEGETTSLDEAMAKFERGQALVKRCMELLDGAELKVRQLSGGERTDFEED